MVAAHVGIYFFELVTAKTESFDNIQARLAVFSFLIYGLLVVAATRDDDVGLPLMAGVCVWLLFSGSFEAWWLLQAKLESKGLSPAP